MTVRKDAPENQSIVVSGESGAGKTESCKIILFYLTVRGGTSGAATEGLEARLLESNVVLEAFGNAKTLRNNNSSRFGKYMKIQFTKDNFSIAGTFLTDLLEMPQYTIRLVIRLIIRLVIRLIIRFNPTYPNPTPLAGASIETYLLEKSRLVFQAESERNFHILYQVRSSYAFLYVLVLVPVLAQVLAPVLVPVPAPVLVPVPTVWQSRSLPLWQSSASQRSHSSPHAHAHALNATTHNHAQPRTTTHNRIQPPTPGRRGRLRERKDGAQARPLLRLRLREPVRLHGGAQGRRGQDAGRVQERAQGSVRVQ
jgi:hypothetical protein